MTSRSLHRLLAGLALLPLAGAEPLPENLREPVSVLRSVGPEGRGNVTAAAAWQKLAAAEARSLPALLAAMDGANDYALNWLRGAIETVADRHRAALGGTVSELERFIGDTGHSPRARRLAFELVSRADAARAATLLPGFLNDPGNELRRAAVQQLSDSASATAAAFSPALA